jgi:two-component system LytT family sensor kinase
VSETARQDEEAQMSVRAVTYTGTPTDQILQAGSEPAARPQDDQRPKVESAPIEQPVLPSLLTLRVTWTVLAWWTVFYGLASWFLEYAFSRLDPATQIPFWFGLNRVVYAFMWAWALMVAIVSTERFPITDKKQFGRITLHALLAITVSILWGVVGYYVCVAVVPGWVAMGVPRMLAATTKVILFGYGLAVLLIHVVIQVRLQRHQEIELLRQAHQATEAQLQLLKMEMQPHFLFNALHAVSAQMHSDPSAANDTLVLVSDMLRHAVETTRLQEVPLREELAILRLYAQIQQVRFGERLCITWEIDDETLDAEVPHMILQPILENSIKHGLEAYSAAGKILISARRDNDDLCLAICDDGPGVGTPSPRRGSGLGLVNVRDRLARLHGARQSLEVAGTAGGGTLVTICIPFSMAQDRDTGENPGRRGSTTRDRSASASIGR